MDAARVRRDRSARGKTALIVAGVVPAVLMALFYLWWRRATTVPVIVIPSPKLPYPNAHDTFLAASNALLNSKKLDHALDTTVMVGNPLGRPFTQAERESLIRQNAPALNLVRSGLSQTYWAPPARSFYAVFPYYSKFRSIARALRVEQRVKADRGDWAGAVNSGLDAIQLGEKAPHGAVLIGELVGVACEAIGRRELWDEIDHLDAKQARAAMNRLEHISEDRFPFSSTLQEEEWLGEAGLLDMFRKANWQKDLLNGMAIQPVTPTVGEKISAILQNLRLAAYGKRAILDHYIKYMDASRLHAEKRFGAHVPPPPMPDDPFTNILAGVFTSSDSHDAICRTEDDLLLISFALRAYYVEHKAYPQTLEELTPTYLKQIPQDQFAASGTFKYHRDGKKYLLYSVGPDGIDDHGKPIDDPLRASGGPYSRHAVQPNSKGDIVAGINR